MRKYMSKRQRPCDFCRSRKTACRIEGAPPCRSCQLHERECTFVEDARPRKKPLPQGPRGPELLNDDAAPGDSASTGAAVGADSRGPVYTMAATPLGQETAGDGSFPDMSLQFLQDLDMDGSEYQFMFRTPHSPASNASVLRDPARPAIATRTSQGLSTGSSELLLDGQASTNPEVLGMTGDMDPYVLQHYRMDHRGIFKFKQLAIHSVQQQPVPVQFLLSQPSFFARSREQAGHSTPGDAYLRTQLEQLVPPSMGKRLISLYQRFIAPQYPIFSTAAPLDAESSPTHLLAAIYAIAVPLVMYDDQVYIELVYDAFPYPALSQVLNTALAAELHSPNLETVQTALLLVVRPSSDPVVSDASYRWSMMGSLVTAAVNIGLHLDPTSWNLRPSEIALRRRISFVIFSADRWLASSLGRPPLINSDNWLVTSLLSDDKLDCGLSEEDWAQLLRWSSLTGVLDSSLASL